MVHLTACCSTRYGTFSAQFRYSFEPWPDIPVKDDFPFFAKQDSYFLEIWNYKSRKSTGVHLIRGVTGHLPIPCGIKHPIPFARIVELSG
jgi:hypothetical protein